MTIPSVTIVMSPRERFSLTAHAIDSLYANTTPPFEFICIDAGSSRHIARSLASQARERSFKLVRREHYLTPNQARNLALPGIASKYVVFVDNDTSFARGWLDHLLTCAEATGADVVSPLIGIGEPAHTRVHFAGGDAVITEEADGRHLQVVHRHQDKPLAGIRAQLSRGRSDFAEFHCMLVRTSTINELGPLDESLKATAEHLDFCFAIRKRGGAIFFEPNSIVTFAGSDPVYKVWGPPLRFSDLPYFALRWSDAWSIESENHFHRKWNFVFSIDARAMLEFCRQHSRVPWRGTSKVMLRIIGWQLTNRALDLSNNLALRWAKRDLP